MTTIFAISTEITENHASFGLRSLVVDKDHITAFTRNADGVDGKAEIHMLEDGKVRLSMEKGQPAKAFVYVGWAADTSVLIAAMGAFLE